MASKNFTGYLRSSLGDYADHDIWRFTHISTTGEVVAGSAAQFKVDSSGFYDIDVEYGNVVIESKNSLTRRWFNHGVTTINSDTSVTTLPALLNALVPASDSVILQMQSLLSDAESAKNDALQAQSDTESLFNNFDSSVADSVSRVGAFEPDVYIPFNDSLEVVRGYGTHDQIDVSAAQDGSVVVDLPSKSVDFSRASGRTSVDKSGDIIEILADKPAIGKYGINIYSAATNIFLNNTSFGLFDFVSLNATQTNQGLGVVNLSLSGDTGNIIADIYSSRIEGAFSDYSSINYSVIVSNLSDKSIIDNITITAPNSNPTHSGKELISDGVWRVYGAFSDTSNLSILRVTMQNGSDGDSFDVSLPQVTEGLLLRPIIKTTGSPVSSSKDVASIPLNGNMPYNGGEFTLILDVYITWDNYQDNSRRMVWSCTSETGGHFMFSGSNNSNSIQYVVAHSGGTVYLPGHLYSYGTGVFRCGLTYDGDKLRSYSNGNLVGESHGGLKIGVNHDLPLYFGADSLGGGLSLNSGIKNVSIYHRALSNDEIKAIGAPK